MQRGYIKFWRKATDSKFWSRGYSRRGFFLTLLVMANHKTAFFLGREIASGQVATSMEHLAKEGGGHRLTILRMLQEAQGDELLKYENVNNRYTLITICNWETYQSSQNTTLTTDDTTTRTIDATTDATTGATTGATQSKNDKNDKNKDKEPKPSRNRSGRVEYPEALERLWKIHPYGTKAEANEALKKLNGSAPPIEELEAVLLAQVAFANGRTPENHRAPMKHLCRWLKYRGWESGIPTAKNERVGPGGVSPEFAQDDEQYGF